MTLELLISTFAGGIFSVVQELVDAYWPWLNKQPPVVKRIISLVVIFISGGLVFGLSCGGVLAAAFPELPILPCDRYGLLVLAATVLTSLIGHQTTHLVVKKS